MKYFPHNLFLILTTLVALMVFTSFILLNPPERKNSNKSFDVKPEGIEPIHSGFSSTGDFLAFYTNLPQSTSTPFNIDVVSFPSMHGASTTISPAWDFITYPQAGSFLPTNTSAFNPSSKDYVCLLAGGNLLTYNDNSTFANLVNLQFTSVTAPAFLQGGLHGIEVENSGFGTAPLLEADIIGIDLPSGGTLSGEMHMQFITGNPFPTFNHLTMSSGTDGINELYFLSGSNLIFVTSLNIFNPVYYWRDLAPSNNANNFSTFYGVEYKSPGVLLAIRETVINALPSSTEVVEIQYNTTTYTVGNIIPLYDLANNLMVSPDGWVINSEYYSTAYNTCDDTYYISTKFDHFYKSRLIEVDLQASSLVEQILPYYIFGIDWKNTPCSCEAKFAIQQFGNCSITNFVNISTGSNPMTCYWDFGDPNSGTNNTSTQCQELHQFSTCGIFNVCLTINANGCMDNFCQTVTVSDNVPPVALCKSGVVIALDANCTATLQPSDIDDGSSDNCFLQSLSVSQTTFNTCGNYPVTLTVTDWCGNSSICNTVIQVVDNIPPVILCPSDIYLTTSGPGCSMIVNGLQVTTTDNCGIQSITYTVTGDTQHSGTGDASGLIFDQGTSVVTYTTTDNCGNTVSCSFNVVLDCACDCPNNIVQNPGFSNGAIGGALYTTGHSNFWARWSGSYYPYVIMNEGCCDPVSLDLGGVNFVTSIYQQGLNILAGHHYKISFWSERQLNNNSRFAFVAASSPIIPNFNPWACGNCTLIGINTSNPQNGWSKYSFPIWNPNQNWDMLFIRPDTYLTNGGIDNICIQEIIYSCCGNQAAFEENASNLVNIWVDQSQEEVELNLGSLLACNRISYIDWGDGTEIIHGPIDANTSLTHIYPDTNVYEIQYLVQEFDPADSSQVCFEKLFAESVQIEPDSCFCNAFSSMHIRSSDGTMSIPLSCHSPAVTLPCSPTGAGFSFTGLFECTGMTCKDTSTISWRLSGPLSNEVGLAFTNPYFSIDLLPTYFSHPGLYTLILSGFCGNESCDCEIQFMVDCQDLCPCTTSDIQIMDSSVNKGFSTAHLNNSCKVCFTPIAVSDCETVSWFINGLDGIPIGTTVGNESICYNFSDAGIYPIVMAVNRKKPDGTKCETFSKTQSVTLLCEDFHQCSNSLIENGSFSEGAVPGGFNSGGSLSNWSSISGEPVVIEGSIGSLDGWTVQLTGNLDDADVLIVTNPICFTKSTGVLTISYKAEHWGDPHENLNGKHIKDWEGKQRLFIGDNFDISQCEGINCYELGSIDLSIADTGWIEYQIPYDLQLWPAIAICINGGTGEQGIEARLALFVTSPYGNNQGGIETRARVQIDEVCIDQTLVSVSTIEKLPTFKIYPNPTIDALMVEISDITQKDLLLRFTDLNGSTVFISTIESENSIQTYELPNISPGMYFIQLMSHGQLLSINKFVKQ
jgi:hypothetical protein